MRILLFEIKKAILSPVILSLFVLIIAFNLFLIYENAYIKDDLEDINQIANKHGTEINDDMLKGMQSDYEARLEKVNDLTSSVVSKSYESMQELFTDRSFYLPDTFSEKELDYFNGTAVLEFYYFSSLEIDESFLAIDPIKMAEQDMRMYGISGEAAELIRKQYDKITERYEEVLENKEYKHIFPAQKVWETHLLLFKKMFKAILLEGIILTVLVTAYIMNFEFDRGTHLLAYSSKRGRNLWLDKFWAALITNVSFMLSLMVISLAAYFSVFSYRDFWGVPISSFFNAGKEWFMSWWNLSFSEYLAAVIMLSFVLIILFTMMTAMISRWVRNSYLVFFIFLCVFGMIFANQAIFPSSSILFLFGYFTPVNLVLNSFIWFMQRALTLTAYFEVITVTVWFVLLLLGVMYSFRSFRKSDLT